MALKRSFTLNGVVYPEAYSRIASVTIGTQASSIHLLTYASEADRHADAPVIWSEMFGAHPSSLIGDVYKLAYDTVLARPDFAQAVVWPDGDDVKPPEAPAPEPTPEPTPPADPELVS